MYIDTSQVFQAFLGAHCQTRQSSFYSIQEALLKVWAWQAFHLRLVMVIHLNAPKQNFLPPFCKKLNFAEERENHFACAVKNIGGLESS